MNKAIRTGLAAFALGATALSGIVAGPAFADPGDRYDQGNDHRDNGRHNGWDRNRSHWNRYDYDRPDPVAQGYYPERYYHPGRTVVVTRDTRVYRGGDGRYYCRRSDGTTGLIAGAVVGGVLGSQLDRGRSNVLGTLLGAGAGAAIGSSLDRGQVTCR